MPSTSGGNSRSGQSPATTKIKHTVTTNPASTHGFSTMGKKGKVFKNSNNPLSPSLQSIIENPPLLNTSQTTFNFNVVTDNTSIPDSNIILVDNQTIEHTSVVSLSTDKTPSSPVTNTDIDMHATNYNNNNLLHSFTPDYNDAIIILAECIDQNINMGNWHPISAAKFFTKNFIGISNIKPAGSKKIKITFNSILNGNNCLNSDIPRSNGFHVNIPSSLIYSYGIIKLDINISEEEFFEGQCSPVTIEAFKRISIQKDGKTIQTRTVELKFIAPKIPSVISIYNMIFEVMPSIRSPIQCNRCLRFGHTQKYCRSEARCSHCGETKHSIDSCPSTQATDPICLYCKLPHLATDRSCREWRFKNCITPLTRPDNEDWFDVFCSKIAPCYVPTKSESLPRYEHDVSPTHILTNNFSMSELNYAISSRKSTASGLDNISPVMLKHLPAIALESLLALMNNILSTQQIPPSWCSYKVIPIAKQNSNTSFRPIALSSALCKIFEHMLKSRKGRGTTECLSSFIGNIYHSLNNKEFFVATSIDIRGAFDSVNIGTLISYLKSLNVPQQFNNILIALFNKRNLVFSSPFGSYNSRSTFTGLPQGSCISPILFNIYMCIIAKHLTRLGHKCLIYADDMVIFTSNKSIDLAITLQNQILNDLKVILDKISFEVAPEKSNKKKKKKKTGYKFKKPKLDTCKTCDTFVLQIKQCKDIQQKKLLQQQHETHKKLADLGCMQKKEDKINALASNNIRVLVFDLEQVLDTPALSTNVSFYKRLLSTFNLTIRDCSENEGTECYMWHEAIGRRGSNEIASCLYQKILNLLNNVTHIITYSDTCGGQNRNINMAAMLSLVTANSSTLHIIDQKFLLPGHTHLECDVDHTKIERAKKFSDIPIMIPRDWYQFVRTVKVKKPFKVIEMKQEQFYSFSNLVSTSLTKKTVDTDGNKVNWFHIRWIRYEKVYGKLQFKYSLNLEEPFSLRSYTTS
ncbi:hypothetical protein QTP88_011269 [Uroleucon formosanum]